MKYRYHHCSKFCIRVVYSLLELTKKANYKLGRKLFKRIDKSNKTVEAVEIIVFDLIDEYSAYNYYAHDLYIYAIEWHNDPDVGSRAIEAYKNDILLLTKPRYKKIDVPETEIKEYVHLSKLFQKYLCPLKVVSNYRQLFGKFLYENLQTRGKGKQHKDNVAIVFLVMEQILGIRPFDEILWGVIEGRWLTDMDNLLAEAYKADRILKIV